MCCGVKYFWQPNSSPFRRSLTKLHKQNALAKAIWDTDMKGNVFAQASGLEETLDKMGYTLFKRRNW